MSSDIRCLMETHLRKVRGGNAYEEEQGGGIDRHALIYSYDALFKAQG